MKKTLVIIFTISIVCLVQFLWFTDPQASDTPLNQPLHLQVNPKTVIKNSERLGVNLGTWSTWGAEQLSSNILMNPGFEGDLDRVVVIVTQTNEHSFFDMKDWGYDDNYWNGASFEVRTGPSEGFKGVIEKSVRTGEHGLPQYTVTGEMPQLVPQDIIILTKETNTDPVPLWWLSEEAKQHVHVDQTTKRPGSPGKQSLRMEAPSRIDYYLDTITDRAGKLLVVDGHWRLSFWMKSDSPDTSLSVVFRRLNGTHPFVEKTITGASEWKEYSFDFNATDDGPPQTIQFTITLWSGDVWLDDVFLGPIDEGNNTGFRKDIIDALKLIKPSFIRDTQGQLGDTYENRVADIFGRRSNSSRAYAGVRNLGFSYSIGNLLALCKTVGADPWIVVPPTFSYEEAFLLGKYLKEHAGKDVFSQVIVEFGNENWNWVFRATGIPYPEAHGHIATKVFQNIIDGSEGKVNLETVVNGQHTSPPVSMDFLRLTPNATALAIAPYFFYKLDKNTSTDVALEELFKEDEGNLKQIAAEVESLKKKLIVYEVNLHTTQGNAPGSERDEYTASEAAGAALAKRLLEAMTFGIQPQMVFSLLQYDSDTWDIHDRVKLWGIMRDVGGTHRFRPQGLAVQMLNAVIGGEMHLIENRPEIIAVGFKQSTKWTAVVVNSNKAALEIELEFPADGLQLPNTLWTLDSKNPTDTNEESEKVKIINQPIEADAQTLRFVIPPWSLIVLGGEEL